MLSTFVIIDAVLIGLIALWVIIVNIFGNTDAKGGVGFVAFILVFGIVVVNAVVLGIWRLLTWIF